MTTDFKLENVDIEDVEDVLKKVETSFGLKFASAEMAHVRTFGQLCDHISKKIQLDNSEDCTSQQAFYKLRKALSQTLHIDIKTISLDSSTTDLFPRQQRRSHLKNLESQLGFKLRLLKPPLWVTLTLVIVFIVSGITCFFNWRLGLVGVTFSCLGIWFSNLLGNELDLQTLRQVANKMTRENYLMSRRDSKTFNKSEVEKVLIDLLSNDLGLEKTELMRDAVINGDGRTAGNSS